MKWLISDNRRLVTTIIFAVIVLGWMFVLPKPRAEDLQPIPDASKSEMKQREETLRVAEMSMAEMTALIGDGMLARDLMLLARRATNIALFDHGVTPQERAIALHSLPRFDAAMEASLKNEPDAWKAYQKATAYHRAGARQFGVGSLAWLMEERRIPAAEVVSFITREEYADLLPDFLQLQEPKVILNARTALLEELSTARAREGERPLDVLQRLATSGDRSLPLLLDARQLGAIGRANIEPDAAKGVLSELGMRP